MQLWNVIWYESRGISRCSLDSTLLGTSLLAQLRNTAAYLQYTAMLPLVVKPNIVLPKSGNVFL